MSVFLGKGIAFEERSERPTETGCLREKSFSGRLQIHIDRLQIQTLPQRHGYSQREREKTRGSFEVEVKNSQN